LAVFQSLAQVRRRWGRDQAQTIWDALIVKLLLGGSFNPANLSGRSRMIASAPYASAQKAASPVAVPPGSDRRDGYLT
jgi:hypothetical protein